VVADRVGVYPTSANDKAPKSSFRPQDVG
jgi:hypothetical protein